MKNYYRIVNRYYVSWLAAWHASWLDIDDSMIPAVASPSIILAWAYCCRRNKITTVCTSVLCLSVCSYKRLIQQKTSAFPLTLKQRLLPLYGSVMCLSVGSSARFLSNYWWLDDCVGTSSPIILNVNKNFFFSTFASSPKNLKIVISTIDTVSKVDWRHRQF